MQIQYENRGGAGHLCGAGSVSDFGDAFLLDDTGKEYDEEECGISAVEIKMFAVSEEYQDLFF